MIWQILSLTIPFLAFVLSLIIYLSRKKKAMLEKAQEDGIMQEKQGQIEKEIRSAHKRISIIDKRQDAIEAKISAMDATLTHVSTGIDRLLELHLKEGCQ